MEGSLVGNAAVGADRCTVTTGQATALLDSGVQETEDEEMLLVETSYTKNNAETNHLLDLELTPQVSKEQMKKQQVSLQRPCLPPVVTNADDADDEWKNYEVVSILGQGSYGTVYKVTRKSPVHISDEAVNDQESSVNQNPFERALATTTVAISCDFCTP